jgi:hypothetical protein
MISRVSAQLGKKIHGLAKLGTKNTWTGKIRNKKYMDGQN